MEFPNLRAVQIDQGAAAIRNKHISLFLCLRGIGCEEIRKQLNLIDGIFLFCLNLTGIHIYYQFFAIQIILYRNMNPQVAGIVLRIYFMCFQVFVE